MSSRGQRKGWSLPDMAAAHGYSTSAWSRYENGSPIPPELPVKRFAWAAVEFGGDGQGAALGPTPRPARSRARRTPARQRPRPAPTPVIDARSAESGGAASVGFVARSEAQGHEAPSEAPLFLGGAKRGKEKAAPREPATKSPK
ncbi:helix-turn-helix domain-containing protein [Embleya sp. NBC_00888]|uniref:helix-turn-helix domain-containing protein n=1 Tax=Embleya sp. NBC_00888 TaxID=2975960 RepID=UPI003863CBDB